MVKGKLNVNELDILKKGVMLKDGMTAPAKVKLIKFDGENSYVEISIIEGRNRQVRRMFEAVGHEVRALRRIKVGNLTLGNLEKGQFRYLTDDDVEYLKKLTQYK